MNLNHLRTFALLAGLMALFVGVGYLIGGPTGMVIALVIAGVMNVISYWNADKIVLSMYGAKEVGADHLNPVIAAYVADVIEMAENAGMPRPRITIIENDQPNAFATGRDPKHAAVAATTGLLTRLNRREVRGVMGHELAHVRNRDTLTMTITATIAGAISALANFALFFGGNRDRAGGIIGTLALMILAPLAASLVQMAISRAREYKADAGGAEISGDPQALASALEKIDRMAHSGRVNEQAERNPATAHMFIINPLNGKGADNLFSTHPNTQNRVAALMEIVGRKVSPTRPSPTPNKEALVTTPWAKASPKRRRKSGPWS